MQFQCDLHVTKKNQPLQHKSAWRIGHVTLTHRRFALIFQHEELFCHWIMTESPSNTLWPVSSGLCCRWCGESDHTCHVFPRVLLLVCMWRASGSRRGRRSRSWRWLLSASRTQTTSRCCWRSRWRWAFRSHTSTSVRSCSSLCSCVMFCVLKGKFTIKLAHDLLALKPP